MASVPPHTRPPILYRPSDGDAISLVRQATSDPAKRSRFAVNLVSADDAGAVHTARDMGLRVLNVLKQEERTTQARRALQRRIRHGATKISCDLQDTVIAVDISPNGDYFAAGGNSKEVGIYDTMTGKEVVRAARSAWPRG